MLEQHVSLLKRRRRATSKICALVSFWTALIVLEDGKKNNQNS
jgi:hypothetical protein